MQKITDVIPGLYTIDAHRTMMRFKPNTIPMRLAVHWLRVTTASGRGNVLIPRACHTALNAEGQKISDCAYCAEFGTKVVVSYVAMCEIYSYGEILERPVLFIPGAVTVLRKQGINHFDQTTPTLGKFIPNAVNESWFNISVSKDRPFPKISAEIITYDAYDGVVIDAALADEFRVDGDKLAEDVAVLKTRLFIETSEENISLTEVEEE